ncbi:hypothetical protein GGQ74_002328 [Desulfobaculum xiamenense]|uniref:CAAX prenyl protease 2/Lysostaphin resistance protein A-like domain-containing protein n=1 Tax=Desulfobaculum xiamenense TaxID=995050 RepID=A0A846QT69_9BACT|nr:JDVT-CTERM system glutamic-type intramembrane protease [Desulfobaculum xiamenense]NJB68655.1 hypothetical protein [Desulfobaculum xiamenense]
MTHEDNTHPVLDQALRFGRGLRDPLFLALVALGAVAFALPRPHAGITVGALLFKAAVEETVFRLGVQDTLAHVLPAGKHLPLSSANVAAAVLFAALHLIAHPPLWAALTFAPSIAFGLTWDRHRSLPLCILLHFIYNILYFHRPFSVPT